MSILFLTPPILQTSDLERSDRNFHFKSDNYIFNTENAYARGLTGGAFSPLQIDMTKLANKPSNTD